MTGNRTDVAVVGMACRYPGAASPRELWDNALAGRCAFRRIPPQRLRLEDYAGDGPDSISLREAAVLEDWQLDRVAFRVAGPSWRAADHAHWLALEVAARALEDAGRPQGEGLDREATGVLVGNSLTGEFSRAGQMRLRWPYVRRTVGAALAEAGWDEARRGDFLAALEGRYKEPFPEPGEETLAGGLANTIAGRIANHFDLGGGGYTVDGACASSLLAVANACSALAAGDLEVALAGGVDLSLDPFELVGFSRTGAFARDRMRVYDARSGGFLPGEGCGMVVLVRLEDARRQGLRVHAVIRGWGVSSDGAGGLTRPKTAGQLLALQRAYRRAGFGADTVGYFEGHGTGTAVGDPVELEALAQVRRRSDGPPQAPAAVGSVKAVIGHTKAAAGVAGLLKAVMALGEGVLPPTIGCDEPHPVLAGEPPALRTLDRAEPWPGGTPPRAGVSAFGFGGINAHVVLEAEARAPLSARRRGELSERVRRLDGGRQDVELLLLAASDRAALADRAEALAARAEALSQAELSDLAAELARPAAEAVAGARGCVVAGRPGEAAQRLRGLAAALREDGPEGDLLLEPKRGFAAAQPRRPPRLGFLFPGQGVPGRQDGGAWARRFPEYEAVRRLAALPEGEAPGEVPGTDVAQPAIAAASLGALAVLQRLGLDAAVGLGHSLGELVALAWAGSLGGEGLLRLARARGAAMAAVPGEGGAMTSLACDAAAAEEIVAGTGAVLAGLNGPRQTVVSGPVAAVEDIARRARQRGVASTRLRVSHAFHSPAMEAAVPALAEALAREAPAPPSRRVMSTITGDPWSSEVSPAELLVRQLTAPVRFTEALEGAGREGVDLWIEVGPGRVLGEMAVRAGSAPVASLDAGGPSLGGLLGAAGAAWVLGAPLAVDELFRDRYTRPLGTHAFLANPCESAPLDGGAEPVHFLSGAGGGVPQAAPPVAEERPGGLSTAGRFGGGAAAEGRTAVPARAGDSPGAPGLRSGAAAAPESGGAPEDPLRGDPLALLRALVAERAELPPEAVGEEHRMLSDLHLNSIAVGQLVVEAARRVGAPPPASPTDYADATLAEIARVLADRAGSGSAAPAEVGPPAGIDTWVRTFRRRLVAEPLAESAATPSAALLAGGFHLLAGDAEGEGEDGGLATALRRELSRHLVAAPLEEAGLRVVLLPEEPGPRDLGSLLRAAQAPHHAPAERSAGPASEASPFSPATSSGPPPVPDPSSSAPPPRLVVVHRSGGAGFARSFHLERPAGEVVVVELPRAEAGAEAGTPPRTAVLAAALAAEALAPVAAGGYREAVLDAALVRHVPRLEVVPFASAGGASADALPLGPEDVLLVTGGGRGIAAESGLDLARRSGAALVLVGRSRPQESRELAENLERFAAAGVRYRYLQADVTDAAAVAEVVAEARRELGPVTAVLHGAGRNRPRLVGALAPEDVARTLAVKVDGLAHVLAAVEPERLRLLVAFGSIIAEMGVRGEADYALANELMARQVERFAAAHPACRCRTLEWSVWSGVGMGERLGTLESLMAQGITPIPAQRGVEELAALLARPDLPTTVVVAGRFGEPPTVTLERPDLPFLRFLETSRVHVPGVELVVEAEISDASDPYLEDHVFGGERLFPAVLGLEAMAQVAAVLAGLPPEASRPAFEDVLFDRPVVVSPGQRLVLRLAGLVRDRDRVEVVLRSSATGFQLDHFRAVVRLDRPGAAVPGEDEVPLPVAGEAVPIDPHTDLYGGLLFHRGRFRRLVGYRTLRATHCVAEIGPRAGDHGGWFARHLPAFLVLGDPGARDAVIHSVQASIPHATVLPTGVERLLAGRLDAGAAHRVEARERSRDGRDLVYDLEVFDAAGRRVELWEGLGLRAVADRPAPEAWPVALLAPHVERRLGDLVPGARPSVVLTAAREGEEDRRSASDRAVAAAAAGRVATGTVAALNPVVRFRRPDGRRVTATDSGKGISVAHGGGLVMAVAGEVAVGCDLEPVATREPGVWRDLLGPRAALAQHLAGETGEDADAAATRVWAAGEALKKLGLPVDAPLTFVSAAPDGWVLLAAGGQRVGVLVTRVGGREARLALAVALPAAVAVDGRLRAS